MLIASMQAKGTAQPSMVYKALVEKLSNEKMSKDVIMYSAAQVYTGEAVMNPLPCLTFIQTWT